MIGIFFWRKSHILFTNIHIIKIQRSFTNCVFNSLLHYCYFTVNDFLAPFKIPTYGIMSFFIHFYDDWWGSLLWVINDLVETEYVEEEGRVFIYNSDSDDCPDDTGRNWYFWDNGDWKWDFSSTNIHCKLGLNSVKWKQQ